MRRARMLLTVAVGIATGLGAFTVPSPAAQAAASGSISSTSGVLYPSCLNHRYRYSLSIPAGATDWDVTVNLFAPDGTNSDIDFLFAGSNATTGSSNFLFCGSEMPGRYTIRAHGEWFDSNFNTHRFTIPASAFRMRRPHSRTHLRVSTRRPRKGQVVRVRITVTDERPRGFFRTQFASVLLQHRAGRRWVPYRWSRTVTNRRGRAWLRAPFRRRPVRIRARTLPNGYTTSFSRVVRIRR